MGAPRPIIAASERTAAAMLDMPITRFRELVAVRALPKPVQIGDEYRWPVSQLEAILTGKAAVPEEAEDFEL